MDATPVNQHESTTQSLLVNSTQPPQSVKLILFDLDGTLADTLADIALSMNMFLEQFNLPTHPKDAYRHFVGDGVHKLIERALPADQQHRAEELLTLYLPYLSEHGADHATLYLGINDMLDGLVKRNIKLAVLSNKPHPAMMTCLEKLTPQWSFEVAQGQVDDVPHKPDPTAAITICNQMNIDPANALFVGDTHIDMTTANRANIFAVGCTWGFRDRHELVTHGANAIIDKPSQLLDLIDQTA